MHTRRCRGGVLAAEARHDRGPSPDGLRPADLEDAVLAEGAGELLEQVPIPGVGVLRQRVAAGLAGRQLPEFHHRHLPAVSGRHPAVTPALLPRACPISCPPARRVHLHGQDPPGRAALVWQLLVGPPRPARGPGRSRITPVEGLSALSLDALTSVAYGPEAIILVLAVAGAGALHLVLPITIAIVALLAILVFSYRQVIDAYPMGGGAYAVSRANLGTNVSLVAAAALVVDYTLTVAVSIAAGVASLQSAFPGAQRVRPCRCAWASSSSSPCSTCAAWARRPGPSCCRPWCSSWGCSPSSWSGWSTRWA